MGAKKTEFIVDPSQPTVVMKRIFDAPRHLVYEAMTNPAYLSQWYGPHGFSVVSAHSDLRPGGAYRIVQRSPQGHEFGFRGVNKEVVPPSRLVYTWIFEPLPDKEALVTALFEEREGKTHFTNTLAFQTLADRDGYLSSGAQEGATASMDRLDQVILALASQQSITPAAPPAS
jgi:uncharacterized protein YndB with AHSA1/START domain